MRDPQILLHMKENYQDFLRAMYAIYRATHLMFLDESELESVKTFSKKILQKGLPSEDSKGSTSALSDLQKEVIEFLCFLKKFEINEQLYSIDQVLNTPCVGKLINLPR